MSDQSTVQLPPLPPDQGPPDELPPDAGPPEHGPRRRWVRITLIAVLAILLVAAPLTLYLLLDEDSPDTGGAGGGGVAPSQAPGVSAEPSGAVTSPGAPGAPGAPAPDGRIPREVLRNATIDVPRWPADNLTGVSGRVTFRNGEFLVPADSRFDFERHEIIGAVTYGDVDRDGAAETVVQISTFVQGGSTQLVALDRNRAGAIVTMGTVVATTGEIREIDANATRVTSAGVVEARLADFQRCCGDETPQIWQTRGYTWNGGRFRQTSGPATFPLNPRVTETDFTISDLVLGPDVDDVRRGTLTVTIRHDRGTRPHHYVVYLKLPAGLDRDGTAWPPVRSDGTWTTIVDVPAPGAGATATYRFAFRRQAALTGGEVVADVRGANAAGATLSESNPWNGVRGVAVRNAG
jgi:hypothetical protein